LHTDVNCFNNAVGVASPSKIPDDKITASSQFSSGFQPAYGRLHGTRGSGCWCARQAGRTDDWLQVDIGKIIQVCGVATQGERNGNEWVTDFKLLYSSDGKKWRTYKDENAADVVR